MVRERRSRSSSSDSSSSSSSGDSSDTSSAGSSSSTASSPDKEVRRSPPKQPEKKDREGDRREKVEVPILKAPKETVKSSRDRDRERVRERERAEREREREREKERQRERKPSPEPTSTRVHIGRLTRSVTRDHILEIFEHFGAVKMIDMPSDRFHPEFSKGYCYVDYEKETEALEAAKFMDGGQVDGAEVTVRQVLVPREKRRPEPRRARTPPRRSRSPRRRRRSGSR